METTIEKTRPLIDAAIAKTKEAQELHAKDSKTQEDILKARTLIDEAKALKDQVKAINSDEELKSELGELSDYFTKPATEFKHSNGTVMHGFTGETAKVDAMGNELTPSRVQLIDSKTRQVMKSTSYKNSFWEYFEAKGNIGALGQGGYKTLQEGVDTAGGFTVPEDFYAQIIMKKPTPTRIYPRVKHLTTSRDALTIPKVNYATDNLYTSGIRVTWTGENPSSATAARVTDPVFGQIRVPVYTAMMSMPLTHDLMEDSAFDLQAWVADLFSQTIELLRDNMILNGTGVGQPTGILVNPGGTNQPSVVTTGTSAVITGDSVINLAESLPEQYEDNAVYILNKTNTGKAMRTLKDGEGRYLFANSADNSPASLVAGRPKELNGYPYLFSGFMPNIGASTYPMIFGDPQGYAMIDRVGFSVQILQELYAESNQVVILGRIRIGGQMLEDWRFNILQAA